MTNLELFYSLLTEKILILEEKERTRKQKEIEKYQANKKDNLVKWMTQNLEKDIYFWRLQIKYKLFSSLSRYIRDTDTISDVSLFNGAKGLQISCYVEREGKKYPFETEAIIAGGYNIQCLHYRYITKTTLGDSNHTSNLLKIFRLSEDKERLEYELQSYLTQPLTVNNYTSQEWQEKVRNSNIQSYKNRIEKLGLEIGKFKD